MKHIAMVIPGLDRLGGAEFQVLQLARGLHNRQWRVTVITLSGTGGAAGKQLIASGIEYFSLGMHHGLVDPSGWIRFHRWIRREQPDVIHAHLPHAAWIVRWSRLFAPVRVVIDTVHSSSIGTVGRQLGYRYSNWLVDAVSAVSGSAADAYCSARMVTNDRMVVIPNGIDTRVWKAASTERRSIRGHLRMKDEFIWLAAGRLEPVKNYGALLDAFATLPQSARLIIAGTGPMEQELRERSSKLGVKPRVEFLGFERDLLRWMHAADAFVLSSLWEGLPMVLLEAGACELPAVATNVSGSREVLIDGETGLLANSGSSGRLAEAMWMMMRMDPAARVEMGRRARRCVIARFSLETVLNQWDHFYSELLVGRPQIARRGQTPCAAH